MCQSRRVRLAGGGLVESLKEPSIVRISGELYSTNMSITLLSVRARESGVRGCVVECDIGRTRIESRKAVM